MAAVLIYGASALCSALVWRKGFREDSRWNYLLVLAGFVFHTAAMVKRGLVGSKCPIYNLFEATVFVLWTLLAAYLVLGLWKRWRFLAAFASPVLFGAGVFALMPALDPPHTGRMVLTGVGPSLHATLSLLSYGAFGLSALSGVVFLVQERDLKRRRLRAILSLLPPMDRLERVVGGAMAAGFGLLTLGLVTGFVGLKHLDGRGHFQDPKVLWSVGVWILYGVVMYLRWRKAHRGRRLALAAAGSFAFVLLTFWGTNLMSTIHNPAAPQAPRPAAPAAAVPAP